MHEIPATISKVPPFLSGGGEMGSLIRAFQWQQTSLGTPSDWPVSLQSAIGILLHSRFPMFLFWGEDAICFYNDAYRPSLGRDSAGKHPCIGKKGKDVWPEIWDVIGPQIQQVMNAGEATWHENQLIPIHRNGKLEDVYWTYSYSPVFNEENLVEGVFVTCMETTQGVKAIAGLKSSEQALKESKERLEAALQASLTGTFRWKIQSNEMDWDENLDRLFGLEHGQSLQSFENFIARIYSSDQDGVRGMYRRCAEDGTDFSKEFRVQWPDGTLRWLDAKGRVFFDEQLKPWYVTGACIDITDHKAANEALLISEQRFEAAVNAVQGILWTNDANGEMKGEQPGWSTLTGQSFEEYQGYGWSKAVHPEDAQPTINAWNEAVREKRTFEFEHRVKLKDGKWGRFSIRAIPLFDEKGSIREWVGVHTDITQQRGAEELLRESEERLRLFVDHAPAAIAMFDADMRYLAVSRRWLDDYNLSESIIGQSHYSVFPDISPRWKEIHRRGLSGEILRANDDRFERNDGSVYWLKWEVRPWLNSLNNVGGLLIFAEQITERKKTEYALQQSEHRFRSTFENAAVGIAHVAVDGRWLFINQKLSEITGYSREELETMTFQNITHPEDLEIDLSNIKDLLADAISTYSIEKRYIRKDRTVIWANLTVSLLRKEDGTPLHFISIVQDISSRKQAEIALQDTAEELSRERERLTMAMHTGNLGAYEWKEGETAIWWSPEMYEVLGVDPKSFNPTIESFTNLVFPDDREALWRKTVACMESGEEFNMEYRITGTDGKLRWLFNRSITIFNEESGQRRISGIVIDITDRKHSEEKIRRSEKYFRELTDTVPAIIWITRTDGYCTYLNKHWYDYTGQTPEEAEGFGWLNATHPADKEEAGRLFIEATTNQKPYYILYRLRHRNGEYRWAIDSGSPKYNQNGEFEGMIGTVVDVHEQKLAEDKIKESEEQFRTLSNAIPQLAWMTDEKGWLYWYNQRWYDYTGTTFEEMQGWGWKKVHHPDMVDAVVQRFQKALDAGIDWEDTFLLRSKDGEYRWFLSRAQVLRNPDGTIRGWFGSNTDITEQRNAAVALAESENRFRNLADQAPMFIFMADENVNVTYVNKSLLNYLNLKHYTEFTGRTWEQYVHPEDIAQMNKAYMEAWQNQSPYQTEIRLRNAHTNQYNWFLSIGVPRYEGDIFKGFLGTSMNIQTQKELTGLLEKKVQERTEALNAANMELQRSNEDLQQFAHVASHDLKEPVRKVITFQNRLKLELGESLSENARIYLKKIEKSTQRMSSMIDGVLAYSSLSGANFLPVPVDLTEIIKNIELDLEIRFAEKNAGIRYTNLPKVTGSPVLLYQLFYNLISNSLKFTRENVRPLIVISADKLTIRSEDSPTTQKFHRIILEDNGIGFDQDETDRIFQTFSRLNSKDQYEGTGLGLSLCKKIAERHGGWITAEGEPGVGARFIIELPEK